MTTRPASLLVSVTFVGVTGAAALLFAAMLVAIATGAIPFLSGGLTTFAWLVAGASVLFGGVGVSAAIGLWRDRAWAWPLAAAVQLIGTLGALVAVVTSGPQAPTLIGLAVVVAGLVALVAGDIRRAAAN